MSESICNSPLWKLPIPSILNLTNLALSIRVDSNHTLNHLLFTNPLDDISRLHIHQDRIARVRNLVVQTLNLAKSRLQAIPLRRVLFAARGDGDVVGKGGIIAPERQFGERRPAGEEVEYGTYEGLLFVRKMDGGRGLDVFGLDV